MRPVIGSSDTTDGVSSKLKALVGKLIFHPQARRLIDRKTVFVVLSGGQILTRLTAPKLEPKEGFEAPVIMEIPAELPHDGDKVSFTNAQKLVARKTRAKDCEGAAALATREPQHG